MSATSFPDRILFKMAEPYWFSGSKMEETNSLEALEREEALFAAKMRGIKNIQAAAPLGANPAILARHERRMNELAGMDTSNRSVPTPFWNRKDPKPAQGSKSDESSFNLDTPTSGSDTTMKNGNSPDSFFSQTME